MRYTSPLEAPPGRFAGFATRASAPYWAALIGGILPAMIWSTANAFFLGCRDARRQAVIAVIGYSLVLAIGGLRSAFLWTGDLEIWFGREGLLANRILMVVQLVAGLGLLRYLVGRQVNLASYRASLPGGLPWGMWLIAGMAAVDYFVIPEIYDRFTRDIVWIWLPSPLL